MTAHLALIRLRNSTRFYARDLEESAAALIVLTEQAKAKGGMDEWLETLLSCVKAATLEAEVVGTVASIQQALSHVLGEVAQG